MKDTLYACAVRGLRLAVARLPDDAALELGRRLAGFTYDKATDRADQTRCHLARAFPDMSPAQIDRTARRCFEHHGMSVVEVVRFSRLSPTNIGDYVEIVGLEHIHRALERGAGFIALMAHVGNWELAAAALALNGYPVSAIIGTLRSNSLDRLLLEQRRRVGIEVVERRRTLVPAVRALRRNRALAVLPDAEPTVPGVWVDWFGRPRNTPMGPVQLSQRYGAPALPIFIRRLGGARHRMEIGPPLQWIVTDDAAQDLRSNVERYADVIQRHIRSAPEQWIWMHPGRTSRSEGDEV